MRTFDKLGVMLDDLDRDLRYFKSQIFPGESASRSKSMNVIEAFSIGFSATITQTDLGKIYGEIANSPNSTRLYAALALGAFHAKDGRRAFISPKELGDFLDSFAPSQTT